MKIQRQVGQVGASGLAQGLGEAGGLEAAEDSSVSECIAPGWLWAARLRALNLPVQHLPAVPWANSHVSGLCLTCEMERLSRTLCRVATKSPSSRPALQGPRCVPLARPPARPLGKYFANQRPAAQVCREVAGQGPQGTGHRPLARTALGSHAWLRLSLAYGHPSMTVTLSSHNCGV